MVPQITEMKNEGCGERKRIFRFTRIDRFEKKTKCQLKIKRPSQMVDEAVSLEPSIELRLIFFIL
jgi:hypothetical protein